MEDRRVLLEKTGGRRQSVGIALEGAQPYFTIQGANIPVRMGVMKQIFPDFS